MKNKGRYRCYLSHKLKAPGLSWHVSESIKLLKKVKKTVLFG